MRDRDENRAEAVDQLQGASDRQASCSEEYESARGSDKELHTFTELRAADETFAAREAWLKWIDRDY